jgi:anti-sigma factor RsiW
MKVTRDVVRDLLPAYLAKEASPDTRALVEAYLATDEELAREVADCGAGDWSLPEAPPPAAVVEKQALEATRQQLKNRSATLAVAILFTLLPLSFAIEHGRLSFLLIRDAPRIGLVWWATAAVMWAWHLRIRRRLKVTGL